MRPSNTNALSLALFVAVAGVAAGQMPTTKVVVVEARLLDAAATITLVGTVKPARRSRVAAEIEGIVETMPGREGDFVEAGGVLCQLNNEALLLRLAEARARLQARQAAHEELLAGTREQELVRLKAMLEEAAADFDRWKQEMDRIAKLYEGSDSNTKEFYDTRADFVAAQRRKIAAAARYDLGIEGPRVERIARAAFEVAEQQSVVDHLERDLRKTVIRAPFSGYVVLRQAEVGEWVEVGGRVVDMVDLQTVLVRADAPESTLAYMTRGDVVRVKIDALGRSFDGRIKHIIPQADESARTFPIEIEINNEDRSLASGMFARATVPAGPKRAVVAVPKDAIVQRDGVDRIATVSPGARGGMAGLLMAVTVGADAGDWIAITSGNVRPGTRVITHGNEQMMPFPSPIEIVDEEGVPVASTEQAKKILPKAGT